ncbi:MULTISPECIES: hypothetical protein [Nostoc]|jgi:hypothetical protein|uniref:Uncharacterized protein n=1 Tax=Nostoc punctiforme FACHB-252 TaxID=1357509 RepID=A0ABR8HDM8_NOSPU|nr:MULTISPECIES: hypothetical protein [Nostoc]MBC1240036.1 hypothetical protein [Nostoc sp. 2RC]MBD2613401.1 hypothetical protein [Nostoc punctiforme FACHB-252]MBL1199331.1 hypothetical protein [Nostoc sp. GBBB01]MDZ8011378.1 hypothetical protein [Nostoc sp. ZfuVER08]
MTIFTNFLRSLVLTLVFSFVAPIFLVGTGLLLLFVIGQFPGLQDLTEAIATGIVHFLATFGSGTPLRGLFVISLTCGFVGTLFDIYVCYRGQILRIDS